MDQRRGAATLSQSSASTRIERLPWRDERWRESESGAQGGCRAGVRIRHVMAFLCIYSTFGRLSPAPPPPHTRGRVGAFFFPLPRIFARASASCWLTASPRCPPYLRHGCARDESGRGSYVFRSTVSLEGTVSSLVNRSPVWVDIGTCTQCDSDGAAGSTPARAADAPGPGRPHPRPACLYGSSTADAASWVFCSKGHPYHACQWTSLRHITSLECASGTASIWSPIGGTFS